MPSAKVTWVVRSRRLWALRFGDLADGLGVAPDILTARLRQLADDGLVATRPYSDRPLRHEYVLTDTGRELAAALSQLTDWGARHRGARGDTPFHGTCGTDLELRPWCPTCDRPVDPHETTPAYDI